MKMNAVLQNADYIERGLRSLEWFGHITGDNRRDSRSEAIFSKIGQCLDAECRMQCLPSLLEVEEIAALKSVVDEYQTWTNARVYFGSMSKEELSAFLDKLLQCDCREAACLAAVTAAVREIPDTGEKMMAQGAGQ